MKTAIPKGSSIHLLYRDKIYIDHHNEFEISVYNAKTFEFENFIPQFNQATLSN
jgi:hypothetical protein